MGTGFCISKNQAVCHSSALMQQAVWRCPQGAWGWGARGACCLPSARRLPPLPEDSSAWVSSTLPLRGAFSILMTSLS